jgi:dihydroneopterin triphosphate diphosphatase
MVDLSRTADCVSVFIVHAQKGKAEYLLLRRCHMLDAWKRFSKGIKDKSKRDAFEKNIYKKIDEAGDIQGTWQMVSGGVEKGETAPEAAIRELMEETGLTPSLFYTADTIESFYMISLDKIVFVPTFVAFVDKKRAVKLSPLEHDAYEWVSFEVAKERLVFSEQKRILIHIHENFVKKAPHPVNLIGEYSAAKKKSLAGI